MALQSVDTKYPPYNGAFSPSVTRIAELRPELPSLLLQTCHSISPKQSYVGWAAKPNIPIPNRCDVGLLAQMGIGLVWAEGIGSDAVESC